MNKIVVSGANKGIGLATVRAILNDHDDTFVYLGSRDETRGRQSREQLICSDPTFGDRLSVLELDVSRDDSVHKAAARVKQEIGEQKLYGLVNNAGIGLGDFRLGDVLEVNTRGMKRVCDAFLPLLQSPGGRVANVTSAAGPNFVNACSHARQSFLTNPSMTWEELESFMNECCALQGDSQRYVEAGLGEGNPYGISKACANAYTQLLARQHPDLVINACTPGFIETDLTRPIANNRGTTPEDMGMKSPDEGTRATMFLLFGEPEGSGHYYGSDALRSPLNRYRAPGSPAYTGD